MTQSKGVLRGKYYYTPKLKEVDLDILNNPLKCGIIITDGWKIVEVKR